MRPLYPLAALLRQTALGAAFLAAAVTCVTPALADDGISMIRDAEIEHDLRVYVEPIWVAAGLNPKDVSIYIVKDPQINAFVAEGQNLFMNTGTIQQVKRARDLIGIMAHETGHMAGGHLVRSAEAMNQAIVPLILGTLLGVAAMAAGAGDAGAGVLMGGQNIAERSLLAYSREQEAKADQAAVTFLDKIHESSRGLLDTFAGFRNDEILSARAPNPYLQNHPLSEERIAALEDRVEKSPYKDVEETPEQKSMFMRMQSKLDGFLLRYDLVLRKYPPTDQSIGGRYARSIAYYQRQDLDHAFRDLDSLLAQEPNNPYFHELKGQILLENQRVAEAVPEHRRSVELMPSEPLFKVNLGQALVATEDPHNAKQAVDILEQALRQDPDNTFAWDQIAAAYGALNDIAMAELATAEKYYRAGGVVEALPHAVRAMCGLPKGTPAARRAQDIVLTTRAQAELDGTRSTRMVDRISKGGASAKGPRCEGYGDLDGGSDGARPHRRG